MSHDPDDPDQQLLAVQAEVGRLRAALDHAERRRQELELRLSGSRTTAGRAGQPSTAGADRPVSPSWAAEASPSGAAGAAEPAADFAAALSRELPFLANCGLADSPALPQRAAEVLALLIQAVRRVEQTIASQLEVLAKTNPQIKALAENVTAQGLLDVERAVAAVLRPAARLTRLQNYTDLLLRWWTAILTGVQTTIPQMPHELSAALNPAAWELEKKRWSSEAEACWDHFKYVVRQELPLKMGDRMKQIHALKTLEAYSILAGSQRGGSDQQP